MTEQINELIDKNLKVICEIIDKEIFAKKFLDINDKMFNDKYLSEKFSFEMESRGLIRRINELCIVEEFGLEIYKSGGWKKFLHDKKERENKLEIAQNKKDELELKKSKVDLELAEKILNEYPKTKWFARIGFIIAILLALKELYKLFS